MQKLGNLTPIFLDARGVLLDGGYIYVGEADADPETNPIDVFWDEALTVPATQPLRTVGGTIVNGAEPADAFFAEQDYSQRVEDSSGSLVRYTPSAYTNFASFQAASAILDALVANGNPTAFGKSLLLLTDAAALRTAAGIVASLPLTGGTVSGNIVRQGAGVVPYWYDPAMTGARIFLTAVGASDPTSLPGDLWFQY